MSKKTAAREFTGRHMLMVMVGGFGVVVAVNFYMASLATGGFHGVVVDNTYVASQKFNGWLEDAEKARALGWEADLSRDAQGHVIASTTGLPAGATMTAELRRPLGEHEFASLTFARGKDGSFRSAEAIPTGRWIARLSVTAGGQSWIDEQRIP